MAPQIKTVSKAADLDDLRDNAFRVEKLENGQLTLAASFDFTQYIQYRLHFHQVQYLALPIGWSMTGGTFELVEAPEDFVQWYGFGPLKGLRISVDGFDFTIYYGKLELETLL